MARATTAPDASDMTNEFQVDRVKYRGTLYVIHELSAAKYGKTVKQATNKDEDTGVETFDNDAHTRILLSQTVRVGGKPVDIDDLYAKGNRLVRSLQRKVVNMHLEDEPEEEITKDDLGEATSPESA